MQNMRQNPALKLTFVNTPLQSAVLFRNIFLNVSCAFIWKLGFYRDTVYVWKGNIAGTVWGI